MKIIYIDLDGVVADFEKGRRNHPLSTVTPYIGRPDKLPGVYENLEPITDAVASVNILLNHHTIEKNQHYPLLVQYMQYYYKLQ